jgi:5-methylthioribose kinase
MGYRILNEATVVDYLGTRPALEQVFTPDARLLAREVGDGNLNQVSLVIGA